MCLAHGKGAHLCPEQKDGKPRWPFERCCESNCLLLGWWVVHAWDHRTACQRGGSTTRHSLSIMSDCMMSDSQLAVSVADTLTFFPLKFYMTSWAKIGAVALCRSPFSVHRELSWSADTLWTETVREHLKTPGSNLVQFWFGLAFLPLVAPPGHT